MTDSGALTLGSAPLEFVFQDVANNQTVVLEGHFESVEIHTVLPGGEDTTTPAHVRLLDGPTGPMLYVLCVILVYGLSMFLIVGTLARKKSYHKQLDVEVGRYVKGLEAARQEALKEQVQKLRLMWPGNYIPGVNDVSGSEMEYRRGYDPLRRDSDTSQQDLSDSLTEFSDDCIELPATTIPTVIYVDEATTPDHSPESSINAQSQMDPTLLTVPTMTVGRKYSTLHTDKLSASCSDVTSSPVRDTCSQKSVSAADMSEASSLERLKTAIAPLLKPHTSATKHQDSTAELTPSDDTNSPTNIRKKRTNFHRKPSFFQQHFLRRSTSRSGESAESDTDTDMMEEYRRTRRYQARQAKPQHSDSSPHVSTDNLQLRRKAVLPSDILLLQTPKISTVSSPQGPVQSDNSDIDDPVLEKYMNSRAYQSRNRGRPGIKHLH